MLLTTKDRFAGGFIAGVFGGIVMNVFNLSVYILGISEFRYLDWAAVTIYGTRPTSFAEVVFALIAQLGAVGVLGIAFAYLITKITSRNVILRGLVFGSAVWFLLYAITLIYNVEQTIPLRVNTALPDLIGGMIYGITVALTLRWMDRESEL